MSNQREAEILKALEDNRFKWRTVAGVVQQLDVSDADVLEVIADNQDTIVQSSIPSTKGDQLYTTRPHFHETSSALDKLRGAFKGRLS